MAGNHYKEFRERLRTVTVAGVAVPLDLHTVVERIPGLQPTVFVSGSVALPSKYPATPFSEADWPMDRAGRDPAEIVHIEIAVSRGQRLNPRFRRHVAADHDVVELEDFTGIAPEMRGVMRNDEKTAFRGIARLALCHVLRRVRGLFPGARALLVMADGYLHGDGDAHYLKPHRSWKNTEPLARMYERSLGVRVVDVDGSRVFLRGSVRGALARCEGRRRNTANNAAASAARPPAKRARRS